MKRILRRSRSPSRRHQSADELIQGIKKKEEEYLELVQQKNGVYSLQRRAMEVIEKNEKEKEEKRKAARGRTEEVTEGHGRGRSLTKMVRSITRSLSRGRRRTGSQTQERLDKEESASRVTSETKTTLSSSKSDLEKDDIKDVQSALKEMEKELKVAKRFGRTVSRADVLDKLLNVVDTLGGKEEQELKPLPAPKEPPAVPDAPVLRASSYGVNAYTSPDRFRRITKEEESYDSESSGSGTRTSYTGTCGERTFNTNDDTVTLFTNDFTNDYTNDDTNDYTNDDTNDYTNDFINDDVMNYDSSTNAGDTTDASDKTLDRGKDTYGFGKFSVWDSSNKVDDDDDDDETDEDEDETDEDDEETVSTEGSIPEQKQTYTQSLIAAGRSMSGNLSPTEFMKDAIRSRSRPITPVDYSKPLSPIVAQSVVSNSGGGDSAPTSPTPTGGTCNSINLGFGNWLDMSHKDLEKVLDDFLFRSPVSCPIPANTGNSRDSPPPAGPIPLTRSMEHKSPLSNVTTEHSTSDSSGEGNERNHTFEKARQWFRRNKKDSNSSLHKSSQLPPTRIIVCDPYCTPSRVDSPVSYDDRAERAFDRYKVQQKAGYNHQQQQQQPSSTTQTWHAGPWPILKRN